MTKEKWSPNAEQRRVLEELAEEVKREESISAFAREFTSFRESTLSKILAALDPDENRRSYFDEIKDADGLITDLAELLEDLPRLKQERELGKDLAIYPIEPFRATLVAARECRQKKTCERVIQYVAPTGGSKTFLRMFLAEKLKRDFAQLAFVDCRDSWRPATRDQRQRAKLTILQDLCKAMKVRVIKQKIWGIQGATGLENAIIKHCADRPTLLFVDEGRFFSAYALNLFIDLLNRTKLTIVITSTPIASARWHRYYEDEADQVDRRTHAVVRVGEISARDVALFFAPKQFEDADAACKVIADAASGFGHYSLVNRTRKFLDRTTEANEEQVRKAVNKALAECNRAISK